MALDASADIGTVAHSMPLEYLLTQRRAGIIPYRIDQSGQVQLMCGVHNDPNDEHGSGDITDFGGHVELDDGDSIDTAIREFNQETFGVFGRLKREQIGRSIAVYRKDLLVVFVRLDYNPTRIIELFEERKRGKKRLEIRGLVEFNKFDFLQMVKQPPNEVHQYTMFELIRVLFRDSFVKHGNFVG